MLEILARGSEGQQQSVFPEASQRNPVKLGLKQKMAITIVLPIFGEGDSPSNTIRPLRCQAFAIVQKVEEDIPSRLLQHEPERTLSEGPGLPQESSNGFSFCLATDILDHGTDLLLQDIKI